MSRKKPVIIGVVVAALVGLAGLLAVREGLFKKGPDYHGTPIIIKGYLRDSEPLRVMLPSSTSKPDLNALTGKIETLVVVAGVGSRDEQCIVYNFDPSPSPSPAPTPTPSATVQVITYPSYNEINLKNNSKGFEIDFAPNRIPCGGDGKLCQSNGNLRVQGIVIGFKSASCTNWTKEDGVWKQVGETCLKVLPNNSQFKDIKEFEVRVNYHQCDMP